jgi:glutaryl-CoA dehydrogenase
MYPIYTYAS